MQKQWWRTNGNFSTTGQSRVWVSQLDKGEFSGTAVVSRLLLPTKARHRPRAPRSLNSCNAVIHFFSLATWCSGNYCCRKHKTIATFPSQPQSKQQLPGKVLPFKLLHGLCVICCEHQKMQISGSGYMHLFTKIKDLDSVSSAVVWGMCISKHCSALLERTQALDCWGIQAETSSTVTKFLQLFSF